MKLTDEQIIKALECCMQEDMCDSCPIGEQPIAKCFKDISTNALDLIKRLQAEILELRKRIINWRADMDYRPEQIKSEARRGFAERFMNYIDVGHLRQPTEKCFSEFDVKNMLDNLLKEMEEENV